MRPKHPVILLDPNGSKIAATIFEGVLPHNVAHFETKWLPKLKDAYAEDACWNWDRKIKSTDKLLSYKSYALECAGETEGLIQVNLQHISRFDGKHVLYIEYLHAAPWNRKELQCPPRYRPVGNTLFLHAVRISAEEGFGGRIALHSLPGAKSWYAGKLGMTDFGPDENELHYFESDERNTQLLLNKLMIGGT